MDNYLYCARCKCQVDSDGNKYSYCSDVDYYFIEDAGSCPGTIKTNILQCHSESMRYLTNLSITNSVNCSSDGISEYNKPDPDWILPPSTNNYCQWKYDAERNTDRYQWGCSLDDSNITRLVATNIECEAFANDKCSYIDFGLRYTSCGASRWLEFKEYLNCCSDGNDCNYQNIDTENCEENTDWENWIREWYSCYIGGFEGYTLLTCYASRKEEFSCSNLETVFEHRAGCSCSRNKILYDLVGEDSQSKMQRSVDLEFSLFGQWNEIMGCDINIVCDVTTGLIDNESGCSQNIVCIFCLIVLLALVHAF